MIYIDTDILSAFAKIKKLQLICNLFSHNLHVSPSILNEIKISLDVGYQFAKEIFSFIEEGNLKISVLTEAESKEKANLPEQFGEGEKEILALCIIRGGVILSNERRVAEFCRAKNIHCHRIPAILRALWELKVCNINEVRTMVDELKAKDRMGFTQKALEEIFCIKGRYR